MGTESAMHSGEVAGEGLEPSSTAYETVKLPVTPPCAVFPLYLYRCVSGVSGYPKFPVDHIAYSAALMSSISDR